jgi:V-type H+-transporting ATPase subunit A
MMSVSVSSSGHARLLSGSTGSLTVIAAASSGKPDGTGYESVMRVTRNLISALWWLDISLARKKHFPSIHFLLSYSNYMRSDDEEIVRQRKTLLSILRAEDNLSSEISRIGKDSLPGKDQVTLFVARLIREDFLQQNLFSSYDRVCPLWKTKRMMSSYSLLHRLLLRTQSLSKEPWNVISKKPTIQEAIMKICFLKFIDPVEGLEKVEVKFRSAEEELRLRLYEIVPKLREEEERN